MTIILNRKIFIFLLCNFVFSNVAHGLEKLEFFIIQNNPLLVRKYLEEHPLTKDQIAKYLTLAQELLIAKKIRFEQSEQEYGINPKSNFERTQRKFNTISIIRNYVITLAGLSALASYYLISHNLDDEKFSVILPSMLSIASLFSIIITNIQAKALKIASTENFYALAEQEYKNILSIVNLLI